MTTNLKTRNEQEEKNDLKRIETLMQLSFRLLNPPNKFTSQRGESAYKRKGIVLKKIPHSSVRVAKDFDARI